MRPLRVIVAAALSTLTFAVTAPFVARAGADAGGVPNHGTASASSSQPQPFSNADQNNTGANDTSGTNQYASTRDGAPSGNGNGNGVAAGQPCAGCVGKADNKNPPGQFPNGSDPNSGYECDTNQGIGQTNPAHTGCSPVSTSSTTTSTEPPTTSTTAGGPPPVTTVPPIAGLGGSTTVTSVVAALQQWMGTPGTTAAPATAAGHSGSLAFTGVRMERIVLLALACLLLGAALCLLDPRARRRRAGCLPGA
jgi:hypothetical protein